MKDFLQLLETTSRVLVKHFLVEELRFQNEMLDYFIMTKDEEWIPLVKEYIKNLNSQLEELKKGGE